MILGYFLYQRGFAQVTIPDIQAGDACGIDIQFNGRSLKSASSPIKPNLKAVKILPATSATPKKGTVNWMEECVVSMPEKRYGDRYAMP